MPIWLIQILIGVALSVAGTLLQSARQQDQRNKVHGVRGTLQEGEDTPLSFILGTYGTAGHLEYAGTWGEDNGAPNAYFSRVISVSDLPVRGLAGFFVNGSRVTLADTEDGDLGFPVTEFDKDGKHYLWVKFYDGTQTVADPLMVAKFGDDPDRPYSSQAVGFGTAYFIATARVDDELWGAKFPDYIAEVRGIPLYDPRKDSTAGGSGSHRLADPSTWEWSDNPIVAIYNILLGLKWGSEWFWGPQGIAQARLPYDNWAAQMDKCDASVTDTDGSTRARFRCGMEISVDQEPQAVIGELLKACEGRIAEIGGIYKVLVAEPDDPVVSFTDEDIVITEGQSLDPFPGLEDTYNGMTATYPEPGQAWANKAAPPRYRSDLEALDDGRRLPFSTEYKAVPYAVQVQQLMRASIEETRRFRRHILLMPPEWWEYEPLDAAQWTSARNGYEAKSFLITAIEDRGDANQGVNLQEFDGADYDWSSANELPWDVAPLPIARPAPQPMTGWSVAPAVVTDDEGTGRRPAIEVGAAAGLDDVRAVHVQVRESWGRQNVIFDGEAPYDKAALAPSWIIATPAILANKTYQARGKLVPFSGRETEWSDWLTVTTPNVGLGPADLGAAFKALNDWSVEAINDLREGLSLLASVVQDQDAANYDDTGQVLIQLASKFGQAQASIDSVAETAASANSAAAALATALMASVDGTTAQGLFKIEAEASPGDGWARVGFYTRASSADGYATTASLFLDAKSSGESRCVINADQLLVASLSGGASVLEFDSETGVFSVGI